MSHHSPDKSLAILSPIATGDKERVRLRDLIERQSAAKEKQIVDALGPTGDFPHGRIVPHDEGGLMFGVTVFNGRVIFDFGKPIRSIGFTREGALELAELIRQRAEQCPAIFAPRKTSP